MRKLIILLAAVYLFFVSCDNSVPSSPVSSTEEWNLTVPQTGNNGSISLMKHQDGSISCSGSWYYEFFGNPITCKIMNGSVSRDTSFLTLNCSGTASYPPDSSGYVESSNFSLKIYGNFKNGNSSGNWEISFTDPQWDEWGSTSGKFSGEIQSGEGVTD